MSKVIDKKTLEYLAELARIEIRSGDKEAFRLAQGENKLLKDLEKILGHFDELKEVNTENVEPMAGGTIENNVFRKDDAVIKRQTSPVQLTGQFPDKENEFLKIPPVFG